MPTKNSVCPYKYSAARRIKDLAGVLVTLLLALSNGLGIRFGFSDITGFVCGFGLLRGGNGKLHAVAGLLCWNWGSVRGWRVIPPAAGSVPGTSHEPRPCLSGFPMPTSNRLVFPRSLTSHSVTSRTAVYGPVRTVVWQGSVGDHRPYADQHVLSSTVRPDHLNCSAYGQVFRTEELVLRAFED